MKKMCFKKEAVFAMIVLLVISGFTPTMLSLSVTTINSKVMDNVEMDDQEVFDQDDFHSVDVHESLLSRGEIHNFGYSGSTSADTTLESRIGGTWSEAINGTGTADYIMAYLRVTSGSYSGNVTAGLYEYIDYSSSYAGDLVAQTEVKLISSSSSTAWWERFDFVGTKPSVSNNTKYYIALSCEDSAGGDLKLRGESLSGYGVFDTVTYSNVLEDPWVGESSSGYIRSLYCSYHTGNMLPEVTFVSPFNGSTNVNLWPVCSIDVYDGDDNEMTVCFYENSTGPWVLQQINSSVSSGGSVIWGNFSNASVYDTRYWWRVCVFDGTGWTNETFSFTTCSLEATFDSKWSVNVGAAMHRDHRTADVNGDGIKEILVVSDAGHFIKAYSGNNGSLLWSYNDPQIRSAEWGIRLEIADLNNDDIPEIVCGLEPAGVLALHGNNGSVYWKLTGLGGDSVRSSPVIFDFDLDGYPTIFVSAWAETIAPLYSISYNGTIICQNDDALHTCAGGISIMDYDNDGHFEIYLGGSDGGENARVQSYWAENLTLRCESEPVSGHHSAGIPVLVDVDGDGIKEVICEHSTQHGEWLDFYVFSAEDLSTLQFINPPGNYHLLETAVYDIDDDGHMELISAGAPLIVYDLIDQTIDFQYSISATFGQPVIADVTGDGEMEIVCPTQNSILIFNNSFNLLTTLSLNDGYICSFVSVDDVDNDGLCEIVVNVGSQLQVFDTIGIVPDGGVRGGVCRYSEYRQGVAEYVTFLGLKDEQPLRDSMGVSLNPMLSVNVTDYQLQSMNVTFRTNASGSWQGIISYNDVVNGVCTATPSNMSEMGTIYYWSVNATDQINTWTNMTYSFTTFTYEPVIFNPFPENNTINVPISLDELNFTLIDYQDDLMNYTVTTNPDAIGGPQTGNNITDGTRIHIPITSTLLYNTIYTWYVNVTDGNYWTNRTYTFTTELEQVWWDKNWTYRKEITIDHEKVAEDLNNFPILIKIIDTDLKYHAQNTGNDIVFTDPYGNRLNHEIEYYNSTLGELICWVNITSLSSTENTVFYMYYGNSSCSNQQNPIGVWDSSYVMVQHLDETSGIHYDSTVNDVDGIPQGSMDQDVAGLIDGADSFDGTNDYINLTQPSNINFVPDTDEFSISLWCKTVSSGALVSKAGDTISQRQFNMGLGATTQQLYAQVGGVTTGYLDIFPADNYWHHIVLVNYDDSGTMRFRFYYDGVADGSVFTSGSATNSFDVLIGARRGTSNSDFLYPFGGVVDEVRVSNVARSAGWISTKYNNQHDPSTFYTISLELLSSDYPIISNPNPENTETNVLISLSELNFTLIDNQDDTMNYSVTIYPDVISGIQSDTGVANNTIIHIPITTTLNYNTTYTWHVNVTDGSHWTNKTFYFTTVTSNPVISNPLPSDDATNIPISLSEINFTLYDFQDDLMNYTITTTPDIIGGIISDTGIINGTIIHIPTTVLLDYNTVYTWQINVTDGTYWTNETFSFTTSSNPVFTDKWSVNVGGYQSRLHGTADVDGDGIKEIFVVSRAAHFVKAFSSVNGSVLWTYSDPLIKSSADGIRPEIADLNNDGIPEVVCGLEPAGVLALHGNNGSVYWKLTGLAGDSVRSGPVIFDLDLDGFPTVFVSTWDVGSGPLYAISYNGTIVCQNDDAGHTCAGGLSIMDYNNDGHFEIYLGGSWGGYDARVQSFWAENLTLRWQSEPVDGHYSPGIPVLADTDGDGIREVINCHSNPDANNWYEYRVFSAENGSTLQIITPGGNYHLFEPSIYDIDDDGHNELIDVGSNRFSVYDLYDKTMDYQLTGSFNAFFQPTVADVTGDGEMDIVVPSYNRIRIYNNTFSEIKVLMLDEGSQHCHPSVDDVDGDGFNEIVVSVGSHLQVFDTDAPVPLGGVRSGLTRYSEYRQGVSQYVTILGLQNEQPSRETTGISLNPILSINATDWQNEPMNITFKTNASGTWQTIQNYSNVSNGIYTATTLNMNSENTKYWWSVNATDNYNTWTNMTYSFTTFSYEPVIINPSPANDAEDISVGLSEISFTLIDYQNDLMNYTVTTNPDAIGGPQTGNNITNGTSIHIPITSTLQYDTIYLWYVNVTDGIYWTNKTYTFTTELGPGLWWNHNWTYRKEITINHDKVTGNLNNFPVLINITDTDLKNYAQFDGDDIAFTDYDGNQLNHEIEYYNNLIGELIAWVNVTDLISTQDTILYMYYGNPVCGNQENVAGVWDSSYMMVQHLDEAGTGTRYDSTNNMNNGTPNNYDGDEATYGFISGADSFDGNDDYINLGQSSDIDFNPYNDEFSISFWFKSTSSSGTFIAKAHDTVATRQYHLLISSGMLHSSGGNKPYSTGVTVNDGNWHHAVFVNYDDSGTKKSRYYIDGSADNDIVTPESVTNSYDVLIGARRGTNNTDFSYPFNGIIDEMRISNIARTTEWISTKYNNQNNPDAFYNIGAEETSPGDLKTIVRINPSAHIINTGISFSIDVNCTPTQYIRGFQFNLSFNSSLLLADDVINIGEIFTSQGYTVVSDYTINNSIGDISYVYATIMGTGNVSDPGRLATINFTAKDNMGTTVLDLYDVKVVNLTHYLDTEVYDGNVTVVALEDTTPPEITSVTMSSSSPLDTSPSFAWENISCMVTDNIDVDMVKINMTYPDMHKVEYTMLLGGGSGGYYYNLTLTDFGSYSYFILANDTSNNQNTSSSHSFDLPPNYDINSDGFVDILDISLVALLFGNMVDPGSIREDVNNDGAIDILDISIVALHFGESWI